MYYTQTRNTTKSVEIIIQELITKKRVNYTVLHKRNMISQGC